MVNRKPSKPAVSNTSGKRSRVAPYGPEIVLTRSAEETKAFGGKLSRRFAPGDVVCLSGDLGSGKTTLVQGIARGMGVEGFVRSSSFILVNEYAGTGGRRLYHMDLYRLGAGDVEGLGLEEYFRGDGICVVEWADRLANGSGVPCTWDIRLSWQGEAERRLEIRGIPERRGARANTPQRRTSR